MRASASSLKACCKVVGVYDQAAKGVGAILTGNENTMVPVADWGQFSEKGGMKGAVDWIPLEMIVLALDKLNVARDTIKGQIYELTGIADIVRGDSKASETLGAQKIKAQFASIRIKKLPSRRSLASSRRTPSSGSRRRCPLEHYAGHADSEVWNCLYGRWRVCT